MSLTTARDIPVRISSANAVAPERRITPSWSLEQFKAKLEHITGIPPSSQKIVLKDPANGDLPIESADESVELSKWSIRANMEIFVDDLRPAAGRNLNFNDLSSVEKYSMPEEQYSALSDSVLAWKKSQKLGRFDPNAPEIEQRKIAGYQADVEARQIAVGKRCRLGIDSARRGTVAFVGEVPEIPGSVGVWVGVSLDEPTGKNDGTVGGKRYFECREKHGVFLRPDRVEVGDFKELADEEDDDMEEI